ncbi:hypothetical protein DID78_01820 [Candidatus Marinamargulisbacteria bacterium SCGC AG-343-D04]|nr:hypothetical protein DID78_01820 [Candidatus Marinamargulisbacteria bacterium SCGC AG-343-D04]
MQNDQEQLIALLKRKGTGKSMSKSLSKEDCASLKRYCLSSNISNTTLTTILVAFLMLDNTPDEEDFLQDIQQNFRQRIPSPCFFLFDPVFCQHPIQHLIHQIIKHKDCSEEEILKGLEYAISPDSQEHLVAAFLEALRLKEESELENMSSLNFFYSRTQYRKIDCPVLIDLSTAYDGFNRHPNMVLFLAPVLASLGYSSSLHGCYDVSPKFGITCHKLLERAGKNPCLSLDEVASRILSPDIGWGYSDQSVYHPDLWALKDCRKNMVKRPLLSTIEKFCCPMRSLHRHIIVTGFTHPAYRKKTISLLQHVPDCDSFMFIRGVEGSCLAPNDRRCPLIVSNTDSLTESFLKPFEDETLLNHDFKSPDISVDESLAAGITALQDPESSYGKWIIYNIYGLLTSLQLEPSIHLTLERIVHTISSGKAFQHWQSY